MIHFNPLNNPYTPTVSLEAINNSANRLEQGHLQAVEQASKLKEYLAQLPLNEKDEDYRRNKINDIQSVLQQNEIAGNYANALDDLILKYGDIKSDQGLIGRLESNKAYQEYLTSVENNKTLDRDTKDRFREQNPYHYEDKYDENGNLIKGDIWQPNNRPVDTIDLSKLIVKAINSTAEDKGGGVFTHWLDAKGNVTDDYTKAVDGVVFNTTTQTYERKSMDKILKAVEGFIDLTPGARASIQQDYDTTEWKYKKEKAANPNELIISDFTDENGITLSPQQYLAKRINPAIEAASYNNVITKTTYGDGLANYKKIQAALSVASGGTGGVTNTDIKDFISQSSTNTPLEVKFNTASHIYTQRNNSAQGLKELVNSLGAKIGPDMSNASPTAWRNLIQDACIKTGKDKAQTSAIMVQAEKLLRDYNEANTAYKELTGNLSAEDKEKFDFISRLQSGAELKRGNKHDDRYLSFINDAFGDAKYLGLVLPSTYDEQKVNNILTGGDSSVNIADLGFSFDKKEDGTTIIRLDKDHYNSFHLFANLNKILRDNQSFGSLMWSTIKEEFTLNNIIPNNNAYTLNRYDENGKNIINFNSDTYLKNIIITPFSNKGLSDYLEYSYDYYENLVNELQQKASVNDKFIIENPNFQETSFTANKLYNQYQAGQLEREDFSKMYNITNDNTIRHLAGQNYELKNVYTVDGAGVLKRVDNPEERRELGNQITSTLSKALQGQKIELFATHNEFTGSGINIVISDKNGNTKRVHVDGVLNDKDADIFDNSDYIKLNDKIRRANATKITVPLLDYTNNTIMGVQELKPVGNFYYEYNNNGDKTVIDVKAATDIAMAFREIEDIKFALKTGYFESQITSPEQAEQISIRLNNQIDKLVTDIVSNTGADKDVLKMKIINQLGI